MTDGDTVTATISAGGIQDIAGNTNNASTSSDNQVTYSAAETTPPTISSLSVASGSLLPGGNHNITINYTDLESGINTSSATIELYKWNGTTWGSDISATGLGSSTITTSSATYPTNNLSFGKYLYAFQISDNDGNSALTGATFYIDTPEIIIGSGSIDIGTINHLSPNFSGTVTITVKTIGAAFNVVMNRASPLTEGTENIQSFSGGIGYGYQSSPFSGSITAIGSNEILATQTQNINTNGLQNTYTYNIQIGALIEEYQTAGNYEGSLDF